jgi:hypothetical protein
MAFITCVPSYGRDYKTAKEVKADYAEGKDFTICDMSCPDDGRKINKQDAQRGGDTLHVYFCRRTKSVVIPPPKK